MCLGSLWRTRECKAETVLEMRPITKGHEKRVHYVMLQTQGNRMKPLQREGREEPVRTEWSGGKKAGDESLQCLGEKMQRLCWKQ